MSIIRRKKGHHRLRRLRVVTVAAVVAAAGCGGPDEVPEVAGLEYDEAAAQIEAAGGKPVRVDQPTGDVPDGTVAAVEPTPGAPLEGGQAVKVTVAGDATLSGIFMLGDGFFGEAGNPCRGSGGYGDIEPGAQVTVADGAGDILAVGRLDAGIAVPAGVGDIMYCRFSFTVSEVPVVDIYQVEVSHRGALTYSFDDLAAADWEVTLTLG